MARRKTSRVKAATALNYLATLPSPDPSDLASNVIVKERDKHDIYLDDQLLTHSYAAAALDFEQHGHSSNNWPRQPPNLRKT